MPRLHEVLVAVSTSRLSCKRPAKREHGCQFGIHLENLGEGNGSYCICDFGLS